MVETILRYKWATFIALVKSILLIWLTEIPYTDGAARSQLTRLSFIATLALPLALAIRLSEERQQWKSYLRPTLISLAAILLTAYYFTLDTEPNQTDTYRFLMLLAGAHLVVSYAPFIGTSDKENFWQFNKTLFLQFLNASLYAGTLYIGLLIAVQTVKYLFNINYKFNIELDLLIVVSSFFHTVFFLSKIPAPADFKNDYPVGLKVFTQYVLLPLEVVYLAIIYTYLGKIMFQWKLPEGGVAYLVLAFSVAGIFALLLLYPLRQSMTERWVSIFSRRYYVALVPLIVLLFIGIFRRIIDYGITENRYIVAVLAFWLAGITLYFLSGKRDDIRWIPVTLSILCFLLPIGPWNIFVVAKNSQLKRFEAILVRNQILDSRHQIARQKTVPKQDKDQLVSIIGFFRNRELRGLEPYFAGFKQKDRSDYQYYASMESSLDKFVISDKKENSGLFTNHSSQFAKNAAGISLAGFDHALFIDASEDKVISDGHVELKIEQDGKMWALTRDKKKVTVWNVSDRVNALHAAYGTHAMDVPQDSLVLFHGSYKLVFRSISSSNNSYFYGNGVLFYR
ncbi:DUF4153 domain-containing protein [Dyadobacter fermentans]|uniref:DUF4153 domain-containing protein n=1 Tax=Dyadobacter fermentans TaxID=94254 RepID=UPI0016511CE4|nr:DUF4153 domain-containing protein [Dyadobacter fermentans]